MMVHHAEKYGKQAALDIFDGYMQSKIKDMNLSAGAFLSLNRLKSHMVGILIGNHVISEAEAKELNDKYAQLAIRQREYLMNTSEKNPAE